MSVILDLLDTAGQEEFSSMQDQWMREGKCFLLVYSITSRQTFDEVDTLREKLSRARGHGLRGPMPFFVIGNKCDLEEQRQVSHTRRY